MSNPYVPRHAASSSTQGRYPWRAAIRTGVQVALGVLALLIVAVPLVIEHLGPWLPESWVAWLAAAVAFLTALSALIARLMAAEPVIRFVSRWIPWLAPGE